MKETHAANLDLLGGALCLDFANTVGSRHEAPRDEYLNSYADLVAWSQHAGLLTDDDAARLRQQAARRPAEATATLERAIALREAIYRLFSAVAAGHLPQEADLTLLNAALPEALAHLRVAPAEDGYDWAWAGDETALDRMLWPVVWSAAELLIAGDLGRVRECAEETCGWLFVDMSRNRSRRWCAMRECGNRVKARRYYRRRRAADAAEA